MRSAYSFALTLRTLQRIFPRPEHRWYCAKRTVALARQILASHIGAPAILAQNGDTMRPFAALDARDWRGLGLEVMAHTSSGGFG
jgi:hypothetical protein